ncbi:uncharacterized protein ELE39_003232 [Cryptosporidium sp. chipmunk genotype I]|uniref:uncharacterized protein n=1 Tax=Cryptosporidium sp. chipmunk genotype I TaxID=1280935 RepID=UPI00351A08E4|nr:hypothetical protein ELE39_003232 [Cryptosporidium sp. chipmunk genotype I]
MPPKSKGQTIQLRDLQRMAYENGEVMEGILPTQSLGLERTDSYNSSRGGGSRISNRYDNDEKITQMLETDWRKGRDGGDLQRTTSKSGRDRFNRPDIDDVICNTNWRDDAGRSTEKPKPELDFRRGTSRNYDNSAEPSLINFNWRDSSNSAQSGLGSSSGFGSRFGRENSAKVHVDDRPDYLKNRFKKKTDLENTIQSNGDNNVGNNSNVDNISLSQKLNISDPKPASNKASNSSSLNGILNLNSKTHQSNNTQVVSKVEKKPKQVKKAQHIKETKKIDDSETNLALWEVSDPKILGTFEKELFTCLTGETPKENSSPASCFEPNTYSPPSSNRINGFISDFVEKSISPEDSQSLSIIAKLSHVFTLFSSALRCIDDVILLSKSLSPIFNHFISKSKAGEATAKLYILIEIQRMASAIGNPKVDNVTSILESLWISLLKSKIVSRDTFNLWLSKNDLLGEDSKLGRKNALFEVSLLFSELINNS